MRVRSCVRRSARLQSQLSQCLRMHPKEKGGKLVKRSGDAKTHTAAAIVLERCSRSRTKIPERGANHRWWIAPIAAAEHPERTRACSIHLWKGSRFQRDRHLVCRTIRRQSGIVRETILHPLQDVTVHIVKTERVRRNAASTIK